ncbi:MAG: Hsp20/alpha crystallin family protein [Leptospiraceae bacterium]|nr:Hsp20/alpha crystallin family protein [Leptospiraceae bacterium]
MLLNVIERNGQASSFWNELDRLQDEISGGFFSGGGFTRNHYNPPVNVYVNKDDALLTALVPGYDPSSIELSIVENKVHIKGNQKQTEIPQNFEVHRQEIVNKDFSRTVELPFRVNLDRVDARFKNGVLTVKLPKAEADKPRKISVQIEN